MAVHPSDLQRIREMSESTPGEKVSINWDVYREALEQAFDGAENALAVTWCKFGTQTVEANIYSPNFVVIGTNGLFACTGKKKGLGLGGPKFDAIPWSRVKTYGSDDYFSEDGSTAKYTIGFNGSGQMLLGFLSWDVFGKRFQAKKNQAKAEVAAEERDRISGIVDQLLSPSSSGDYPYDL